MMRAELVLIFCFLVTVSPRAPNCDHGGNCADLIDWEREQFERKQARTTTESPRTYSPSDFLASTNGSITCNAVSDCPALSYEDLLFKMQLAGSYATHAKGCSVKCSQ